jgi:hypothetical protein
MRVVAEPSTRVTIAQPERSAYHSPIYGRMSYAKPSIERPCSYTYHPPPGIPWENVDHEWKTLPILDARAAKVRPSIDCEGFELWDAPTSVTNFRDSEEIVSTYHRECTELAIAVTGAKKAYIFDHLVRIRDPEQALNFGQRNADGTATANGRVHNDYTEASGRRRLGMVIQDPEEFERVNRYSVVNIWRPLRGPVLDTPLALCDTRSLIARDFLPCDVKYVERTGEFYLVSFSETHSWSYFSQMNPHEAIVFKQYDSQVSGVARFTPHTAFDHPDCPKNALPRQSIEVRCLVTY